MNAIMTSKEMKDIEGYAIDTLGIPSLVLMERAALCVTKHIKERATKKDKICILCGKGNNGADGVAIARNLLEDNYKVSLVVLGITKDNYLEKNCSKEMIHQLNILNRMGVLWQPQIPEDDFDIFVDAIFGIGLTREITDEQILLAMDTINSSNAYIYSVDIPSGIHTDTGKIMQNAVKANETITFAYKKVGHLLYPGKKYAGKVICENIGIPDVCLKENPMEHFSYQVDDGATLLYREPDSHKGTFGKVVVIAGNEEISGACVLCAGSVLLSGAGMVKVLSSDKTLEVIRNVLPEAMVQPLDKKDTMEKNIQSALDWADFVVIGSGIGTGEDAYLKMKYVLQNFPKEKRLVIDADGINLVSKYDQLRELTHGVNNLVYTPHMAELSRLLGVNVEILQSNLDEIMKPICKDNSAIYVCKDSVTRVYQKNQKIFLNEYGNSGMATAGSGDVLAGIVAAMLSKKGMGMYEGTILGVHLHSLAGDFAAKKNGYHSLLASDIGESLQEVLKTMEESLDV